MRARRDAQVLAPRRRQAAPAANPREAVAFGDAPGQDADVPVRRGGAYLCRPFAFDQRVKGQLTEAEAMDLVNEAKRAATH